MTTKALIVCYLMVGLGIGIALDSRGSDFDMKTGKPYPLEVKFFALVVVTFLWPAMLVALLMNNIL